MLFYTKNQIAIIRKDEYLRGCKATAEAFKDQEDRLTKRKEDHVEDVKRDYQQINLAWDEVKGAKKEIDNQRATVILEGMRDVFGNFNR